MRDEVEISFGVGIVGRLSVVITCRRGPPEFRKVRLPLISIQLLATNTGWLGERRVVYIGVDKGEERRREKWLEENSPKGIVKMMSWRRGRGRGRRGVKPAAVHHWYVLKGLRTE